MAEIGADRPTVVEALAKFAYGTRQLAIMGIPLAITWGVLAFVTNKHILGSAAHAARALELSAGDDLGRALSGLVVVTAATERQETGVFAPRRATPGHHRSALSLRFTGNAAPGPRWTCFPLQRPGNVPLLTLGGHSSRSRRDDRSRAGPGWCTRGRPPRRAPGWWSAGGRERGYGGDIAPDPGVVFVWRIGGLTLSSHEHRALARDAAAGEIIAGVAFYGGQAGLKELAADLVVQLAAMIEQLAAVEGRSAVEVADDLFRD